MSDKVVVKPWFDKLCKQFVKDQLNLFASYVNAINTGDLTSTSELPKWMYRLPADEFNDLWENLDKYAKALKNGYVVKKPRKAFRLPNGQYATRIEFNKEYVTDGLFNNYYQILGKPDPVWVTDDEIKYFKKYLVGEVVEEVIK
ncbi:hypothetical protein [Lentilactobacillus farraginis]|nr:hypothetical protein [Lentilactobacillus farraginis]